MPRQTKTFHPKNRISLDFSTHYLHGKFKPIDYFTPDGLRNSYFNIKGSRMIKALGGGRWWSREKRIKRGTLKDKVIIFALCRQPVSSPKKEKVSFRALCITKNCPKEICWVICNQIKKEIYFFPFCVRKEKMNGHQRTGIPIFFLTQ